MSENPDTLAGQTRDWWIDALAQAWQCSTSEVETRLAWLVLGS